MEKHLYKTPTPSTRKGTATNWDSFSNDFYLPFELISIILLVSLICAITMTRHQRDGY